MATDDQNSTSSEDDKEKQEPEVVSTEPVKPSEDIPVDDKTKDKDEKVKVDFMNPDFLKKYVKKKTVKSDEPTPGGEEDDDSSKSGKKEETAEELRERIRVDEKKYENQFTPDDFEEIAGFVIDLFDAGISTALRVWAKDTKTKDYELDESKKKKLAKQGKLILVKHKLKWSVEFVFIMSICVFYAGPIQKARQRRATLESAETSSSSSSSSKGGGNNDKSSTNTNTTSKPRTPPRRGAKKP